MKKKPRIWLARDTEDAIVPGVYNVCSAPPILDEEHWIAERAGTLTTVCCGIFERLAPKSCHLPHKESEEEVMDEQVLAIGLTYLIGIATGIVLGYAWGYTSK
jgi:hypothetical protein